MSDEFDKRKEAFDKGPGIRFVGSDEQKLLAEEKAVDRLSQGLEHHDSFGAQPDDSGIFICPNDTLYELPYDGGQFTLGDLRKVLSAARRHIRKDYE